MDNITLGQVGSAITLIGVISAFFIGLFKWYKNKIADRLDKLESRVDTLEIDNEKNKRENTILLKGQLACLKGLKEQGCNGAVTESISEIESYLLKEAHK